MNESVSVYDHIADHFHQTRYALWECVKQFLDHLPQHSILADVGCGNGKYINYRPDIYVLASDLCLPLLHIIGQPTAHFDTLHANGLNLPYRPQTIDAAICIAVIHHIPTLADRIQFLKNILQALHRPHGLLLFTVWAAEQPKKTKWQHTGNNDYIMPWLDKNTNKTFHRYYHLHTKAELLYMFTQLDANVINISYEKDNWVVILSP